MIFVSFQSHTTTWQDVEHIDCDFDIVSQTNDLHLVKHNISTPKCDVTILFCVVLVDWHMRGDNVTISHKQFPAKKKKWKSALYINLLYCRTHSK